MEANEPDVKKGVMVSVLLGVSRKPQFLQLPIGGTNFWCVHRRKEVSVGGLLLLYFPVTLYKVHGGIRQIYEITSLGGADEGECASRGMTSVETRLLFTLDEGIGIREMKADPVVRNLGAVGRNMQGVTFVVQPEIWPALRELIVSHNPEARNILYRTAS